MSDVPAVCFCPGRVCLVGEDLDWTDGLTVTAAVNMGITASVYPRSEPGLAITCGSPFNSMRVISTLLSEPLSSSHPLRYCIAACQLFSRTHDLPLDRLNLVLESSLPAAAGLSSSAAVTLATTQVLQNYFRTEEDRMQTIEAASIVEREILRTGAGMMDFIACGIGGIVALEHQGSKTTRVLTRRHLDIPLLVIDTHIPRSTAEVIATKRRRFHRRDPDILNYVATTQNIASRMLTEIAATPSPQRLGALLDEAHAALREDMRSSTSIIDNGLRALAKVGAYGGKLTGTGHGGAFFALLPSDAVASGIETCRDMGLTATVASVYPQGLHPVEIDD